MKYVEYLGGFKPDLFFQKTTFRLDSNFRVEIWKAREYCVLVRNKSIGN